MRVSQRIMLFVLTLVIVLGCLFPAVLHDGAGSDVTRSRVTGEISLHIRDYPGRMCCLLWYGRPKSVFGN